MSNSQVYTIESHLKCNHLNLFVCSDRIRPICLPLSADLQSQSFIGSNPFVAGWGFQDEFGDSATVLQQLQMPVLDNTICRNASVKSGTFITNRQFGDSIVCAGILAGGKDSCKGDSGGPLMMPIHESDHFPFYQIGIVAWGNGCAQPDSPGIYTRVSFFVDWIIDQINQ